MLLPTPMLIFLILYSAPFSIAVRARPSQNVHVPLNCGILPRSDQCNVQQCIACGARCIANAQDTMCVDRLEQGGRQLASWTLEVKQNDCRGCYCGKVDSVQQQRKLAGEQNRKVIENETVGAKCTMTSRTSSNTCDTARCFEDGVSCLAVPDGRCYLHDRATGLKMVRLDVSLPETCMPCKCIKAGEKLVHYYGMLETETKSRRLSLQKNLEIAKKLSLKRKIQEHEMLDGKCLMTSRNSSDICHAISCFEAGFRCLPIRDGRCYLHSRDLEVKLNNEKHARLPASCQPCICTKAPEKKLGDSSGPVNSSGNDMAEPASPNIDLDVSAVKALKKMKAG
jgi:hypothetical protein